MSEERAGYEFDKLENQRFTRLAGAMQTVAVLEIVTGLLFAFIALPAVVKGFAHANVLEVLKPIGAVLVPPLIGVWTYRAAVRLRLVVRTEGNDIAHLMDAMAELTKLYLLQLGLWLLAAAVVIWMIVASGALTTLF